MVNWPNQCEEKPLHQQDALMTEDVPRRKATWRFRHYSGGFDTDF
jgi:hypothetical protein